jgi:hypothetical protein
MNIETKNCEGCPFFYDDGGWNLHSNMWYCQHPNGENVTFSEGVSKGVDKDCPLKEDNTLTVTIVNQETNEHNK